MSSLAKSDNTVDLAPLVRHAILYGDECVVESGREMFTAEANAKRRRMAGPVDLTWCSEAERERLIDERIESRAAFRAELVEMRRAIDRLSAEIALARRKAGKRDRSQRRRRQTTPALRGQITELYDRGLVVAVIADTLNVSDRRVRELLRDAGYRRNGHGKRLVQTEKSADTRVGQAV